MMDDFATALDEYRKAIDGMIDALAAFQRAAKRLPYEDMLHENEREHHQRMIYAVYFAPLRSSN